MKLQIHHIELCVSDPDRILRILRDQFEFQVVGRRNTQNCEQTVVQAGKKIFVITHRREFKSGNPPDEPWTIFCCNQQNIHQPHKIDSVFNIAIQVVNLRSVLQHLKTCGCVLLRDYTTVGNSEGSVNYAVLKSNCGNIVHTLIEKTDYNGSFLPGFECVGNSNQDSVCRLGLTSHFDHVSIACEAGDTDKLLDWYGRAFGMRRFLTNRSESPENGLMIGGEVGMRLKVMEFWSCSESGVVSDENNAVSENSELWEPLKLVIVESLPNTSNTQIDVFIREHEGPGIQHIGLYTSEIFSTVEKMAANGVRFRNPPPAYYTYIGQLAAIEAVGENLELLQKCGILLDSEADINDNTSENRYLMQIFTFPIFNAESFFLEVIQRKGAQGFGVGNVTALARSINATKLKEIIGS